ncbi:restriction endonuclease subunit S [Elizabethkingia ursingii]|uniref:restriction endonuclease subunit S n=1 Tax=Elizabethkingia ursingii TaxID=1756150 RepID=UPI00201244DB|nr:restriction endonuclease subunit S [Elizabethkingia ursingii]MCL1670511.1 restriction endonuclease subunit S [Elizabethkingia ursingii]
MTEKNKSVKKFPNLRFPGFEDEWEEKRLRDLGSFTSGGTPKTTNRKYYNGHISFIRSGEINSYTTELRISEEGLKNSSAKMVNKGEILIALYGATSGDIAISKMYGAINQAILCFDTKQNKQFFKNLWQKHIDKLLENYLQGGQGNLSAEIVKQLQFCFPEIYEQGKIASFFEKIEERIETQKKIIEDLQLTKKEISFKLFKDGFNSSESKKRSLQKLGDVTYIVNKKNKENLKLPVYSINNKKGFVSQSEQFEGIDSDERGYDISLYKIIDKETFAYNPARINVGSIGYSRNLENIIISSLYVCFKTTDAVDDGFLFQYLRTDIFRKEVLRNVEGGVRDYLFYENFSRIKINLPDIKEQTKITKFLYKLDEKINLETELLTQYENQKKYLLQNLFI